MKNWFITGINSGIGRQLTEQLLARGERVAGTVRKPGSVDDLKTKYGERLWIGELDVTDTPGIRLVFDRAASTLGRVDVVVNNAGYGLVGAAEELTDAQIVHQIDTNLIGSIQVARAAIPRLRANGGGRIIQISTMGGQATFPAGSLYHTTKWGIEGFMDAIRHELAPFGIGITIVEPGSARTEFAQSGLQFGPALAAYEDGPVGQTRAYFSKPRPAPPGDPAKMAKVIIESADQNPAPLRIALGSDAYASMHRAMTDRLALLESQKDLASSTDFG